MKKFKEVKDSGERQDYGSGMRRDTENGKAHYNLIPPQWLYGSLHNSRNFTEAERQAIASFKNWLQHDNHLDGEFVIGRIWEAAGLTATEGIQMWERHMTNGARKYGAHNWQLAESEEEYERFKRSAQRHFIQWLDKEEDEDHISAIAFNIMAASETKKKLDSLPEVSESEPRDRRGHDS